MAQYVKKIRTDSGDLQIDYNALANLPTISNPNLLINSDFRNPVNQRAQTSYPIPTNTYTIDRWKVLSQGATLSVNNGYIKVSSTSGPSYFIQKCEKIPMNEYITVSINVKSLTSAFNVYIGSELVEEHFSISSTGITTYTTKVKFADFIQLNIEITHGAQAEFYWAKVEQGIIATPFVPRLYAEELTLCQRYYQYYDTIDVAANGIYDGMKYFSGFIFPTKMRVAPTVNAHYESAGATVNSVLHHVYNYGIGDFHHSNTSLSGLAVQQLQLDAEIY